MTLPSTVVYRVAPKTESCDLPPTVDRDRCFFLFEEIVILSREPALEAVEECTARAKVAFLGMYWESIPPGLVGSLFGDERDPIKMFDKHWTISRYTPIVALQNALDCVSREFIDLVRPHSDEEIGRLLDSLAESSEN
jgi:hypothetical protein